MNDKRNPELERLFAAAERTLADDAFVAGVMAKTSKWSVRPIAIGVVVCAAAVPATVLVAPPVNEALRWLMQLFTEPLVTDAGNGIASRLVLPMNNVGAALALGVLVLRAIARRLFPSRA